MNANIASSTNFYYENSRTGAGGNPPNPMNMALIAMYCTVPAGAIRFPKEIYKSPRSLLVGNNNIVQ